MKARNELDLQLPEGYRVRVSITVFEDKHADGQSAYVAADDVLEAVRVGLGEADLMLERKTATRRDLVVWAGRRSRREVAKAGL